MLTVIPIKVAREEDTFDLFCAITAALEKSDLNLQNGDILVVSTKYVSYSQGRRIPLDGVTCSHKEHEIATPVVPALAGSLLYHLRTDHRNIMRRICSHCIRIYRI